jgi:hypothetical protein
MFHRLPDLPESTRWICSRGFSDITALVSGDFGEKAAG